MGSLVDFIFSRTLERFPGLSISYSEAQVGWMPYLLERADKRWASRAGPQRPLAAPPSSYIAGRVYGCIFDDDSACAARDSIGIDQICFETDYPHADSTFPDSKRRSGRAGRTTAGLTDDELYKVARGNAIRAFGLGRFGVTA